MRYLKNNAIQYSVGRSNLALTIFVPYDCPNHCPFCTSKEEYHNAENFDIEKIIESLDKVAYIPFITDIVITGGEPFADLTKLQYLLDKCKLYHKHIYINTTLPVRNDEEANNIFNFILKNQRVINGLNISRHMCVKTNLEDDALIEKIYKNTNIPLRINSVLIDVKAELTRVKSFIDKYEPFVNSINFRGDYTKIKNQDDLRRLSHPILDILFEMPNLTYISSGGCLVCNNNDFVLYNEKTDKNTYISLHRGYEHSCVKKGNYYIINDIIIKQDGRVLIDWDGEQINFDILYNQWR